MKELLIITACTLAFSGCLSQKEKNQISARAHSISPKMFSTECNRNNKNYTREKCKVYRDSLSRVIDGE